MIRDIADSLGLVVAAVAGIACLLFVADRSPVTACAIVATLIGIRFAVKSAMKSALSEHTRKNKKTTKATLPLSPADRLAG